MKVAIVSGNGDYKRLFTDFMGFELATNLAQADLVCFTGGADVTPELYGDAAHKYTGNDYRRDRNEMAIFSECRDRGIPMVGICRGGQFLNVMSGGRMYQHVDKHAMAGGHDMIDIATGEHILVSSTHHQMFMPGPKAEVLAIANLQGEREWYDGPIAKRDVSNTDYEVLYYEDTRALCFQPHPEFQGSQYMAMRDYFAHLVNEKLLKKVAA